MNLDGDRGLRRSTGTSAEGDILGYVMHCINAAFRGQNLTSIINRLRQPRMCPVVPHLTPHTSHNLTPTLQIGPRACYDEGKRVAETLTYAYAKQDRVDVRVARIFNTFGPRMNENDGRVVSNFIIQALKGEDLTVYGEGEQTRSFQYVHDLIDGLIQLMNGPCSDPINLGNPDEYTILEFAEMIRDSVNRDVRIIKLPSTTDDPQRRRPDIGRAQHYLGWNPKFSVTQGIQETVEYFRKVVRDNDL